MKGTFKCLIPSPRANHYLHFYVCPSSLFQRVCIHAVSAKLASFCTYLFWACSHLARQCTLIFH